MGTTNILSMIIITNLIEYENNFYKFSLLFLVLLINLDTKLLANEINFEAKILKLLKKTLYQPRMKFIYMTT